MTDSFHSAVADSERVQGRDDGGPVFPTVDANRAEDYGTYGMALRDYFAAHAPFNFADAVMAADLEPGASSTEVAVCRVIHDPKKRAVAIAMLAALRAEYATAMLKARSA